MNENRFAIVVFDYYQAKDEKTGKPIGSKIPSVSNVYEFDFTLTGGRKFADLMQKFIDDAILHLFDGKDFEIKEKNLKTNETVFFDITCEIARKLYTKKGKFRSGMQQLFEIFFEIAKNKKVLIRLNHVSFKEIQKTKAA